MGLKRLFGVKTPPAERSNSERLWPNLSKDAADSVGGHLNSDTVLHAKTDEAFQVLSDAPAKEDWPSIGQLGSPWIIPAPTSLTDSGVQLRRPNGDSVLLMLGADHPIRDLPPGWNAVLLYTGFDPLLLLELEHPQWGRATWYITSQGHKIGDRAGDLPIDSRDQLRKAVVELFSMDLDPVSIQKANGFWMLSGAARVEIATLSFGHGNEV